MGVSESANSEKWKYIGVAVSILPSLYQSSLLDEQSSRPERWSNPLAGTLRKAHCGKQEGKGVGSEERRAAYLASRGESLVDIEENNGILDLSIREGRIRQRHVGRRRGEVFGRLTLVEFRDTEERRREQQLWAE